MENLRKLLLLPGTQRRQLAHAVLLLPLNALALRLLGVMRWQKILAKLAPIKSGNIGSPDDETDLAQARLAGRMVDLAARRGLFEANCLQRSLALWCILRRYGVNSDLKIGVRLTEKQCEAHAWVEYQGEVLNDSEDIRELFTPFSGAIFPAEMKIQ